MPFNHLILCHPLLLPSSIFHSIRVFSSESTLYIRWPKHWCFSFSNSPSDDSGLISFRTDRFYLLTVQGTLKNLLQHHNLKALVLQHSAFFMVHLCHPYVITRKIIALTIQNFVGKVMSLLYSMLSRFERGWVTIVDTCQIKAKNKQRLTALSSSNKKEIIHVYLHLWSVNIPLSSPL